MIETGKIKNIEEVQRHLRGRRYFVIRKTDYGAKIGTIDGVCGEYMLYDDWLEPDDNYEK